MSVTGKVPTGQRHVSQKTTECNYARRKNIPEMIGLSKEPCFSGKKNEPDGRFSVFPKCQGILTILTELIKLSMCLHGFFASLAAKMLQGQMRAQGAAPRRRYHGQKGDEWDIFPAGQSHLEGYIQVHKAKLRVIALHLSQHFPIISYGHRVIIPHFPIIIP